MREAMGCTWIFHGKETNVFPLNRVSYTNEKNDQMERKIILDVGVGELSRSHASSNFWRGPPKIGHPCDIKPYSKSRP